MLRKHNKLVVLAVLLTFLFSIVGTAGAASIPTDIKGKAYEEAVTELAALDILTGYPDGTFQADNKITRAEFAAVAVRALGLDASAKFSQGATKFSDVTAAHWASGYINVAVDQGLIKGYPDGTFKPEANVTYAESVAILVRALGYEPAVKGEWPTGYLAKGNEIGVTDDVTVVANAPATRGDVAIMTDNSLDINLMYQVSYGTDVEYRSDDDSKTILTEKLDLTVLEEKDVTMTPKLSLGDLDADQIKIAGTTYDVAAGIDPNKYTGLNVTAWIDDDDVVKYIKIETESDRILSQRVKGSVGATDDGKVYLNEKDGFYTLSDEGKFYVNGESKTAAEMDADSTAYSGRIVLDDADKVIFADLWTYNPSNAIVTEVGADYIKYWADTPTDKAEPTIKKLSLNDDDYTYVLMRSGATVDLKAVQAGDLVSINDNDDDFLFASFGAKKVTGKLDEVFNDSVEKWNVSSQKIKVSVGGKDYVVDGGTFSTDNNENVKKVAELADLEDLIGTDVTLYLTSFNEVRHIQGNAESNTDTYGVVIDTDSAAFKDIVKIYNEKGVLSTLEYTDDTEGDDFADVQAAEGKLVKYSLAADGTIDEIEVLDTTDLAAGQVTSLDDDDDYIGTAAAKYYVDPDKTIFINYSDYDASNDEDDLSIVKWSDLEDKDSDSLVLNMYAEDDPNSPNVVLIVGGYADVASDGEIGVVKKVKYDGDDYVVTVDVEGADVTYKAVESDKAKTLAEGSVIAFTVTGSGKMDDIYTITINDAPTGNFFGATGDTFAKAYDTVYKVEGKSIAFENAGVVTWYTTNSSTLFYDVEDGAEVKALSDVDATNDTVTIIVDNATGRAKAVIFKGDN